MIDRDKRRPFSLKERFHSFVYAYRGLKLLLNEHNTWIYLLAVFCVVVVGLLVSLTLVEWAVVIILLGNVWIAEALNTAVERLCDHVTPQQHPEIAHIKDVAAAAPLIAAMVAVVAGLCIFMPPIIEWVESLIQ